MVKNNNSKTPKTSTVRTKSLCKSLGWNNNNNNNDNNNKQTTNIKIIFFNKIKVPPIERVNPKDYRKTMVQHFRFPNFIELEHN